MNSLLKLSQQQKLLPFYHTVTDHPESHLKALGYFRSEQDFKSDLAFLQKHFELVSAREFHQHHKQPLCHLSFDDGLAELYTTVLPILEAYGIRASFFVNTAFLDNKDIFYRFKAAILIDRMTNSDLEKAADYLSCEAEAVRDIILTINYNMRHELDQLAKLTHIDYQQYLLDHQPYLSTTQVQEIQQMGHSIGTHSHDHPVFTKIDLKTQQDQILRSLQTLNIDLNMEVDSFAFPFGNDRVTAEFFIWLEKETSIKVSYGVSGLKKDTQSNHFHRIPMEQSGLSGRDIIKIEYLYFLLKSLIGKNKINR